LASKLPETERTVAQAKILETLGMTCAHGKSYDERQRHRADLADCATCGR